MKVVVTGGTGFLGGRARRGAARGRPRGRGADPRRHGAAGRRAWNPADAAGDWVQRLRGGRRRSSTSPGEPIAAGRWTAARKRRDPLEPRRGHARRGRRAARRRRAGRGAAQRIRHRLLRHAPATSRSTRRRRPAPTSSARSAATGKREARAAEAHARVVLLRTGLVLARGGGALPQLALPFHFFAGGPMGSGRQVMSWIHRDDWVAMVRWALATAACSGPLNLTAPHPVTNREMADALGRALRRPSFLPAPAVRLAAGARRDGRRDDPERPARAAARGAEPRVRVSLREARRRVGGDLAARARA